MSRMRTLGLSWRSVTLGLFLALALCAITPYNDYAIYNTYIAGNHFPTGAVFVLFALGLINVVVYRKRGRPLLPAREVAVVYIIIMVTSGIASSGLHRYLLVTLGTPAYFASPGNRWETLFFDYIPQWMWVEDRSAAAWMWQGLPEGGGVPWHVWLLPLSRWAIFVAAVWVMMICLAALVRKQWVERERLAFPLVQFPLEVIRADDSAPSVPFFRNRLVWLGAAAVIVLHCVNGLHRHFPALPAIPTFWDLNPLLTGRPWEGLIPIYIGIFPSAVGFAYLLSLEVAAGFWGAVVLTRLQGLVMQLIGYEGSGWGGIVQQVELWEQMGAVLGLTFVLLWLLRGSLADAFQKAFSRASDVDDSGEPLSYRAAVFGFLLSLVVMALWLHASGLAWTTLVAFLAIFIAMCLVLTRTVAEAGMLMVHYNFRPTDYLLLFGGPAALGPRNLTPLSFVDCALTFDLREFLMPSVLNAFKLSSETGLPSRAVPRLLALALPLAFVVGAVAFLWTVYQDGIAQTPGWFVLRYHPVRFFTMLSSQLDNPVAPSNSSFLGLLAGAGLVGLLAWLRVHFVWWPLHPLGFAMASSWASINLWFSLFLGWLFKLLTIRYAGLRGYVALRFLFMGAILGDVVSAVLWIIVGWISGLGFMITVF